MRLTKILKTMTMLTIMSLIYINLQMQIYDLAYQGKRKQNHIRKLADDNGNITYNILTLKSANNLGVKLLTEDSDMRFMDNERIVRLKSPEIVSAQNELAAKNRERKPNILLSLFSLKSEAVAQPLIPKSIE